MIYTVTFNPAIDYVIKVDDLTLGKVNRTKREDMYCGGKGLMYRMYLPIWGSTVWDLDLLQVLREMLLRQGQNSWDLSRTLSVSEKA